MSVLDDTVRARKRRRVRELSRGERMVEFIERFCLVPEGKHVGKPIVLAPFQVRFILDVYDNPSVTSKGILSIARKNGKTALIAALLLGHLVGPEARLNSQIISGAQSREQAALVYNLAEKMVMLNPKLNSIVRIIPSSKKLIGLPMNVEYRAIASESSTAHGLSPVLAILDEIGQIVGPQDAFIDAIITAQGAHDNPLILAISTQAPTDADLLSVWIDDAKLYNDPHIVCHVYSADELADLQDEATWRSANPALGLFRSLDDVRKQAAQAARMPSFENTFRNLTLNQRVNVLAPFVSRSVWAANGSAPDMRLFEGGRGAVYGGLDLSGSQDLTSLVLITRDAENKWHVLPYFWTPADTLMARQTRDRVPYDAWVKAGFLMTTPGKTVDYAVIARFIRDNLRGMAIRQIAFDRWRIDLFKKEMDAVASLIQLEPFGQGYKDMSPALQSLEDALVEERVYHGGHPVLTWNIANCVVEQDPAGNRKLTKAKSTGRIDGAVAMAMAMGRATLHNPAPAGMFFVNS